MDKEQRPLLRLRLRAAITAQPEIRQLRAVLLNFGGEEVVAPPCRYCDLHALIHAGFVMEGPVRLRAMERNACHRNLSLLWPRRPNGLIGIGTGYALSHDGLWRQYSWGLARPGIAETTLARAKYFGLLLQGRDADSFASANGWPEP